MWCQTISILYLLVIKADWNRDGRKYTCLQPAMPFFPLFFRIFDWSWSKEMNNCQIFTSVPFKHARLEIHGVSSDDSILWAHKDLMLSDDVQHDI